MPPLACIDRVSRWIDTRMAEFFRRALVTALAVGLLTPGVALGVPKPSDLVDGATVAQRGIGVSALPDVTMKEGLLVDGDGRVLWSRNADQQRAMASITKIMTAVVALERADLNSLVTIPKVSTQVGESTSNLRTGERLPLQQVLEALLVKSGNDAAIAITLHVSGSQGAFVKLMNEKAAQLGMTHTHFANPHGLDEPGHYTTASDLSVLARYAMSKPEFRRIVGLKSVTIGSGAQKETLTSTNVLLGNYLGANGIKTGFTNEAGYSVIESAQRDGVWLIAVVLGTSSELQRFRDARDLLDWGFAHYRPQTLATSGTVVAQALVSDYLDVRVDAKVAKDVTIAVLDINGPITRTVTVAPVKAPVHVGEDIGAATFTQKGRLIASIPLVATSDVGRPNLFERVWIGLVRGWRAIFGSDAVSSTGIFGSIAGGLSAAVSY